MKKYFAQLRPLERRLAVAVLVVLFLVLNYVFVWPHFSDWSNLRDRQEDARRRLLLYQTTITQSGGFEALVKKWKARAGRLRPRTRPLIFFARSSRRPRAAAWA